MLLVTRKLPIIHIEQMKSASDDIYDISNLGSGMIWSGTRSSGEYDANKNISVTKQSMVLHPFINNNSSKNLLGTQRIQESPSLCLSQIEKQLYNLFLTNNTQSIINTYESCGVGDNSCLSDNKSEINRNECDKNKYDVKMELNMDVMPIERTKPIDFSGMKFIKCSSCSKRHIVRYNKQHKVENLCIACSEKKKLYRMKRESIKNKFTYN